jgi:hypothetical protein
MLNTAAGVPTMGSKSDTYYAKQAAENEKKWRADADLRTLIEAEKIKADPERLKPAMALQKEMKESLEAIAQDAKSA